MKSSPADKTVSAHERKKLKTIAIGIAVRLGGGALIWLGDGHDSLFSKGLVICGVIISVTGIGILRYLLLSPMLTKMGAKIKAARL